MTRTHCFSWFLMTLALGLFAVSPANAQTYAILHYFGDGSISGDGITPASLIMGRDGNFYGTCTGGGSATNPAVPSSGGGVVFKMTPLGAVTILHSFGDGTVTNDGTAPDILIQGADENFYGSTTGTGATGYGTLFKITPSGTETTLYSFEDGSTPNVGFDCTSLIQGADGNFYGTTNESGSTGDGAVFKMTPSGKVTALHDFPDSSVPNDGEFPAALVQSADGNFYGITVEGGASTAPVSPGHGEGTVFKMTPSGMVTILHSFDDGTVTNDGIFPYDLIQDVDGNFYGISFYGGSTAASDPSHSGYGTVFKMTPSGTVTILHNFDDGTVTNDGAFPTDLIHDTDGNFYGVTYHGGPAHPNDMLGDGVAFKMTPSGAVTILHFFNDGTVAEDGFYPTTIVQGNDNGIYGTTTVGGSTIESGDTLEGGGTAFSFNGSSTPLTISSLSPTSASAGGPTFPLTITGTNFTNNSTVTFGGMPVTITTHLATQLTVTVLASAITAQGAKAVSVTDPVNGSAAALFTVGPPALTWNVQDVAAVSDGTARLLWDRSDGAAGIWALSAGNIQTLAGPVYGPYTGWTAQDVAAVADGTSRILWNRYDGATGVWAMDARGNETSIGPTYGPFSGWKAIDLATAPNGTSRLMWRYTNGQAGLLSLNSTGGQIISGRSYGPYTGWAATAVGAAGDGTARMLWTRSDGAMGLWTMDANDLQKMVGPTYGPYSDSRGTWRATDLSTSADGTSQVLWKRSDGAIGVWTFSAADTMTTVGAVYGPYAKFTAAALDAAGDKARVLWVRSDRAAGVWSFGTNDLENFIGPVYGPY